MRARVARLWMRVRRHGGTRGGSDLQGCSRARCSRVECFANTSCALPRGRRNTGGGEQLLLPADRSSPPIRNRRSAKWERRTRGIFRRLIISGLIDYLFRHFAPFFSLSLPFLILCVCEREKRVLRRVSVSRFLRNNCLSPNLSILVRAYVVVIELMPKTPPDGRAKCSLAFSFH